MTITWPTSPIPSQSSTLDVKPRWKSCQFGDGYRQTAPDGINYIQETWQLQYENLSTSDYNTIKAAADSAMTGDFITWTAPIDASSKTWRMAQDGYIVIALSGSIYSITVTLERAF